MEADGCDRDSAAVPRRREVTYQATRLRLKKQPHHYILRVGVVGEGAVVEHDLVECLGAYLGDL